MDARDDDFLATPEDRTAPEDASTSDARSSAAARGAARGPGRARGAASRPRGRRQRWGRRAVAAAGSLVLVGGGASALTLWASPEAPSAPGAGGATAAAAQVLPAPPTGPEEPGLLERWLGGGVGGRDDHDEHDHDHDHDHDEDEDELRGTLTGADASSLTVATAAGEVAVALDATTEVIRDHGHVGAAELAAGQDVVVVPGADTATTTASTSATATASAVKVIIIG